MFCKKCGKSIKDNVCFCPYCGAQTKKKVEKEDKKSNGLTTSFLTEKEQGRAQVKCFTNVSEVNKKKLIGLICGVVIFIFLICIIILPIEKGTKEKGEEKEYSVIGEWGSDDLSDLGSIMGEAVGGGLAGDILEDVIGNTLGEATVTFSESGRLYLSFYDMSIEVGEFTYEIISNNRMRLAYEIEVPVLGNSVTASCNASYKVNRDTMTLEFFEQEITLYKIERD